MNWTFILLSTNLRVRRAKELDWRHYHRFDCLCHSELEPRTWFQKLTICRCNPTGTNSIEQSSSSASQEIPRILSNQKVHYCGHTNSPLFTIPIKNNQVHVHHPTSWRPTLILPFRLRLGLPSGLFPSGFRTRALYAPPLSPPCARFPAHLILLELRTRVPFASEYRPSLVPRLREIRSKNTDFTNFVSRLLGLIAQFIWTYFKFQQNTWYRALQLPKRSRFTVTIGRLVRGHCSILSNKWLTQSSSHLLRSLKSCPLAHESWINNRINSIFSIDSTQLGAAIAQSV
jgi:hypothetical protein